MFWGFGDAKLMDHFVCHLSIFLFIYHTLTFAGITDVLWILIPNIMKYWIRFVSVAEWLTMARSTNNRASLREKLQEEFLSCKICLEPFIRPKALPCLHSFCEHCLRDYVRRHPGEKPGHFPCPMCRKDTLIPPAGICDFTDNFLLLSLSDTLDEDEDHWAIPHSPSGDNRLNNSSHISPPRTLAPPTPQEQHLRTYE